MKIITEDTHDEIDATKSLNKYMLKLREAVNDETATIALYDEILKLSLPAESREIISEILDDEKDHLVLVTELLNEEIHHQFPDYGDDEDNLMKIENEDEDK